MSTIICSLLPSTHFLRGVAVRGRPSIVYSNSIVPIGFGVISINTLLIPSTSRVMRLQIVWSKGYGISSIAAVIASVVFTARMMAGELLADCFNEKSGND